MEAVHTPGAFEKCFSSVWGGLGRWGKVYGVSGGGGVCGMCLWGIEVWVTYEVWDVGWGWVKGSVGKVDPSVARLFRCKTSKLTSEAKRLHHRLSVELTAKYIQKRINYRIQ